MRFFLSTILFLLITGALKAQTNPNHIWVDSYTRNDGTFVRGHYKTKSNSTVNDNFSTYGNINPYTQEPGWRPRENEEMEYDPHLEYNIPTSFVFTTKQECQLDLVNTMNMWTLVLNKHFPSELDRPFWSISNSILYTELEMDVWEVDEDEISKGLIELYFSEIEINSKTKGLIELLISLGVHKLIVRTPNHEFEFGLASLEIDPDK